MKNLKLFLILFSIVLVNKIQAQNDEDKAQNDETVIYEEVVDRSTLKYDNVTQCQIRYYYYPNIEAYYDILKEIYYIKADGEWTIVEQIPSNFRGYSVYNNANIPVDDYEDDNITEMLPIHRKRFGYITKEKVRKKPIGSE